MQTPYRALLGIALDLTSSLTAEDRYDRLLGAVRRVVPCDAASLLRLEGDDLVPLAAHGLCPEALGQRFSRREHPRLDLILRHEGPLRFPDDTDLPDPFDGLLEADPHALHRVHACLGWPLVENGEVVGALTADALAPTAFDDLDPEFVAIIGALAGAALRTTGLIERLEGVAAHRRQVTRDLVADASERTGQLLGSSPPLERVRRKIDMVAPTDLAVLIQGETGVGKELVARSIHAGSARRDEPLIYVNCAALPEAIAESELFGHVRGAFTSATSDRPGKFEVADGGTLFLDEIGELPLSVQPKLLRALQEGEIQRVGSDRTHRVDVRVLAATNRELEREIEGRRFRADLYHRLAVFPITVPPLRERRGDVLLLSGWFLDVHRRRLGLGPVRLDESARQALLSAEWPGNVRELDNVLGRGVLHAAVGVRRGDPVTLLPEHLGLSVPETAALPPEAVPLTAPGLPLREAVERYQRRLVAEAVDAADGNWAAAARTLGLHRSNLHHLARRLGLR